MTDLSDQADREDEKTADSGHPAPAPIPAARTSGAKRRPLSSVRLLVLDEAEEVGEPRLPREKLLAYGAQAAIAACLFGMAWAAGVYFSNGRSPLIPFGRQTAQTPAASGNPPPNEMALVAQRTADDIRALKADVEALRASQSQMARQATALEGLKKGLDAVKNETGASIAELSGKVERLQHEPQAKLSQIIERLDHLDKAISSAPPSPAKDSGAPANTAKQLHAAAAKPVAPEPASGERHPQLISNWVVRDVYDGVALVESPHGAIEVIPGETIPGAGVVKSIERRGGGWIVITSRGVVDSARDMYEP
ncbi:MAG TPA: hypothetical protein VME69_05705 [Methylocella sp.]|nr:hypothetical protein [Methylocella sp.]